MGMHKKYSKGGSKGAKALMAALKAKGYKRGGSFGDGLTHEYSRDMNMKRMAAGGGLKGFMAGGSTYDGMEYGDAKFGKSMKKKKRK